MAVQLGKGMSEVLRGASEQDDRQMPSAAEEPHFDLEGPCPTKGPAVSRFAGPLQPSRISFSVLALTLRVRIKPSRQRCHIIALSLCGSA